MNGSVGSFDGPFSDESAGCFFIGDYLDESFFSITLHVEFEGDLLLLDGDPVDLAIFSVFDGMAGSGKSRAFLGHGHSEFSFAFVGSCHGVPDSFEIDGLFVMVRKGETGSEEERGDGGGKYFHDENDDSRSSRIRNLKSQQSNASIQLFDC